MKMNALQLLIMNHKITAFALGAILTTAVGSAITANIPPTSQATQTYNQVAAQAQNTSTSSTAADSLTIPATETTPEYVVKDVTQTLPQDTTQVTTQATTQETTQIATAATTTAPAETAAATTAQKPAATTAKETAAPTTKATAAPTTAATTAAVTAAASAASLGDNNGTYDSTMAQSVLALVNQERTAAGVGTLTWNDTLAASAAIRATEIVVSWSHTRPDGSPWYTAGAQMQMGENLAYGQTTADQVMSEWMASQGHKDNILRSTYTMIGISCYYDNGVYYWAQHFA